MGLSRGDLLEVCGEWLDSCTHKARTETEARLLCCIWFMNSRSV